MRNLLNNLSIKTKLALIAILSLSSLAVVGLSGFFGVHKLGSSLDEIQNRSTPAMMLMIQMRLGKMESMRTINEMSDFSTQNFDSSGNQAGGLEELHSLAKSILERIEESDKQYTAAYDTYLKLPKKPEEEAEWKKVKAELEDFNTGYSSLHDRIVEISKIDQWDAVPGAMTYFTGLKHASEGYLARITSGFDKMQAITSKNAVDIQKYAGIIRTSAQTLISLTGAISIVVVAGLTFLIIRNVISSLGAMKSAMVNVAMNNDFTSRMHLQGRDEIAQTAKAFDSLLDSVQGSLREVLASAGSISSASIKADEAAKQVTAASKQQSESTSAMATSIEEMTVNIQHISDNTHEVLDRSKDANGNAIEGETIIRQAAAEMDVIDQTVSLASRTIDEVGEQSNKISTIMNVIKELADQTKLLALNAAIEAARAGEQGRGFAVVADEVRKLSDRTASATEEIGGMILTMQSSSKEAVNSMETIVGKVRGGKEMSVQAAGRMTTIKDTTEQVAQAINGISSALNEQSSSAQEISRRVDLVTKMTEENCRVADDTSQVAFELTAHAEALRTTVNRFRI